MTQKSKGFGQSPGRTRLLALVLMLLPLLHLPFTPARGQAGPPAEVVNQARVARTVTPSDTVDLPLGPTRGLYIGSATACPVAVILADDTSAVTFAAVPTGTFMPIRAKRVLATGTTCTPIIGMW
jgi:hypothetical protein